MFIRKDQPSFEKAASVVDQLIAYRAEHVYVYLRKVELLKLHLPLVCFIKEPVCSYGDLVSSFMFLFLAFFISQVVCKTDLGVIVHFLGPELHLKIGPRQIIVKGDMKGLVARRTRVQDIVAVERTYGRPHLIRHLPAVLAALFRAKTGLFEKSGEIVCYLVEVIYLLLLGVLSGL